MRARCGSRLTDGKGTRSRRKDKVVGWSVIGSTEDVMRHSRLTNIANEARQDIHHLLHDAPLFKLFSVDQKMRPLWAVLA